MRRFEGRVAIVTGGASGIGLATAMQFAAEGANVVVADLHQVEGLEDKLKQAGAQGAMMSVCDVSNEGNAIATVKAALDRWNRLDVVVNNAGLMVFKPLVEHTLEDWLKVLTVDLLGAFYFTKQALLNMKPGGAIVNVSSIHAEMTEPLVTSYAAAKAAVLSLTRSTALEGKPLGIRANAVLPGAVDTPMLWDNPNVKSGQEKIATDDVGKPEEVASAIAYLASDEAKFIQGAMLRVDGGRLDRL